MQTELSENHCLSINRHDPVVSPTAFINQAMNPSWRYLQSLKQALQSLQLKKKKNRLDCGGGQCVKITHITAVEVTTL